MQNAPRSSARSLARSHRSARLSGLVIAAWIAASCGHGDDATESAATSSGVARAGSTALRPLDATCPPRAPAPDPGPTPVEERREGVLAERTVPSRDECTQHRECAARPHGRCVRRADRVDDIRGERAHFPAHNECVYDECVRDADCRQGEHAGSADRACGCDVAERNTCVFANCRTDADCPPSFPCGAWRYCHSEADACRTQRDCATLEECVYSWDVRHYVCRAPELPAPG